MTVLLPPSRALSHQLASRASQLGANRRSCANPLSRVVFSNNVGCWSSSLQSNLSTPFLAQLLLRSYATKPAKPKAHTGRVAASKRKPAAARSDAVAGVPKKAPAKKAPAKKTAKPKKTAAKKPARKVKTKTKTKTKKKPKPKPKPKRKVLTEIQKATIAKKAAGRKIKDLRQQALLNPPKRLPATAFTLLFAEATTGKGLAVVTHAKEISAQYKNLRPEELERLNHVANENKAKNDAAFKKWLEGHTPAEIRAANAARNTLKKQAKLDGRKKTFNLIQDERLVKQPRSTYAYFLTDRFASGDMKHMKIAEVGSLIGREWRALSAAEKKPYQDKAAKDKARYIDEYTTVYGTPPAFTLTKAAKTAA